MKPTVGRIVHYTNLGDRDGKYPPEIQAALVTKVESDTVLSLCIFYPTGQFFREGVHKTDAKPGTENARGFWNWPERV